MPRPNVPAPKDVIAIAKGLKSEGINCGAICCPDGTQIQWGEGEASEVTQSVLERWRAVRNEAS